MSELTHGEGTPWSNAVGGHQDEQRLSNEAINSITLNNGDQKHAKL